MSRKLLPAIKIKNLPVISDNNINSYFNFVNTLPILSLNQEQELAKRYKYKKDLDAAQELILSHLRFVTKIARNFSGYKLSIADLIQEGNIGLMKAIIKFDPDQGVRLVSFAVHWIKAEMHDYILKNWKIVKIATTKAQRKLFFNLRSSKGKVSWLSLKDIKDLATELRVKEDIIIEMEKRMYQGDASLDLPYLDDNNEQNLQQSLYLEDKSSNIENQIVQQDYYDNFRIIIKNVLNNFDVRTKDIITSRYLLDNKATLHDLAIKYNISAERVRQIEEDALSKLKRAIKSCS